MDEAFYDVEQIAQMLSIHPKTIQRYIREGKLAATKIGKSWRVSGRDFDRFAKKAAISADESEAIQQARELTRASSVVDLSVGNKEQATRIINTLTAVMNVKPPEYGQASMHAQFIEMENTVRITLWGNIRFMAAMLNAIEVYAEHFKEERV